MRTIALCMKHLNTRVNIYIQRTLTTVKFKTRIFGQNTGHLFLDTSVFLVENIIMFYLMI